MQYVIVVEGGSPEVSEARLPIVSLASLQLKKLDLGCCALQTYDTSIV